MKKKLSSTMLSLSLAAGCATLAAGITTGFAQTQTQSQGHTDYAPQANVSTTTLGPIDNTFVRSEASYTGSLTSGDSWHGYLRQMGRDLTVTLPQAHAINSISIELKQDASMGVYYPNHVTFEVYSNGQWYNVGTAHTLIPSTDKRRTTQTYSIKLNNIQAQNIRVEFPVSVWAFARHLHIYGTPGAVGQPPNTNLPPVSQPSFTQPLSPYESRAHGIKNMLLVYTGAHGSDGLWTQADFAPMIGYSSLATGQTTDKMFDTILFTPYPTMGDSQSGWQSYINDLFAPNQQLHALDAAVAQTNQALGTYGTREKVVLTVPYPAFGDGNWGYANGQTLNFDGTGLDPNGLKAREQALDWYLQQVLSAWQSANFQNLDLTGLYWENETVSYESPGEVPLIQYAVNASHQHNLPLYWIPFYDAAGITDWQSLGFDAAWLQPNFIEQGSVADVNRIRSAEDYAKQHGFGLELELTGNVSDTQYQDLYAQTISQLEQDGFAGNVSHAFYAGSKTLVKAYNSYDFTSRLLYDNTHEFISHP